MNLPHGTRKDVREAAGWLRQLGWRYKGVAKSGHLHFDHPVHGRTDLPTTPSRSWHDAKRQELARMLGLSKVELERRLGLRARKHTGPRRSRHRNERGVAMRRIEAAGRPIAAPVEMIVGSVEERREQIARELADSNRQVTLATLGTPRYRQALEDVVRLRREYIQLDAEAVRG